MKEFKTLKDLFDNMHMIPEIVAWDVIIRIEDWISTGGKEEDPYIQKQLQFANQFIDRT